MGSFKPLNLSVGILGIVKSNMNGLVNEGPNTGFCIRFDNLEVALQYKFYYFVIGCFEIGFFNEGSWRYVGCIEHYSN